MIKGLYTSALGMTTQMKRMDVVANNIANANTTGFKRDIVATQSFSAELAKRLDDPSGVSTQNHDAKLGPISQGVFVDSVHTDFTTGNLVQTGGTYDLAILDSGFFSVLSDDGTRRYTRDGSFTIANDHTLRTKDGYIVEGQNGAITLPEGFITFSPAGEIFADGEYVDALRLADFENPESLRKYGDNLYATSAESFEKPVTGSVQQGFLESSNTNAVREMVDMITVSRLYETNQRMVTIHDTILGRAVAEIGKR